MPKEYLGKTKNGFAVYLDTESSHALTHFANHSNLRGLVEKAIPTIDGVMEVVRVERDMGEIIGASDLVETNELDEIVYAKRPLRTGYSRFVKNRESVSTSWITIDLRKSGEKEYSLYTAFIGRLTPSFPGGNYLPEQSREFWSKHALVWGGQEVVPGSETTRCPW